MKNVIIRSISGLIYVALIVTSVLCGGWFFNALITLFIVLGTLEYQRMSTALDLLSSPKGEGTSVAAPWALRAVDMAVAISLPMAAALPAGRWYLSETVVVLLFTYMLIRMSGSLAQKEGRPLADTALSVLGLLYIALPLTLLIYLRGMADITWFVMGMFILIWLNDTGAFCVGCTLGKHKLCPRLSPKKSWEGFWGGFVTCTVAGALLSGLMGLGAWWHGLIYGALVSVAATWGDLFESLLKRTAQVKDSGNIIPGHGGILDRIDSLLFVIPLSLLFRLISLNI